MIHISEKHRVVGVPFRQDLAQLFPHARQVSNPEGNFLVIPHGLEETRVMRNLGVQLPAPVECHYDWAGGKPFQAQVKTAALLTMNRRAYVLNGMGTGKTKAALWSLDYLMNQGLITRALVLAPLSTLNFTWAGEVLATVPHRSVGVLHGSKQKRLERLEEEKDIYILNHDGLSVMYDALSKRFDIDALVIDELAVFRNATSQRSKLARKYASTLQWVWGMTGSPTPNEPTDAWGQAQIVTPHTVPKRFTHFRDEVMTQLTQYRYSPKPNALDRVYQVLQPAVRYTLDDIVELPDVIERTVEIDMGPKQAKIYKQMKQHAYAQVQNGEITAVNAGVVLNKLLQISCGWVYDSKQNIVPLDNDERLDALVDAINSTNQKVLVFVPFVHALEGISARLKKEKIDFATVHGGISHSDRSQVFNAFQNSSKYKVIVAHPNTMAHGLTLTAADTVIWFAPITSLEVFDQANARIRRVGQKHKQQVLMFAGTAVEKKVYATLRRKQSVQGELLRMFEEDS